MTSTQRHAPPILIHLVRESVELEQVRREAARRTKEQIGCYESSHDVRRTERMQSVSKRLSLDL